jgi:hypothetical protein
MATQDCTYCEKVLKGFPKHLPQVCPFRKAMYCSYCSIKGHSTADCPVPPPDWAVKPVYVEQFLPGDVIKKYNITTKTLLPGCNDDPLRVEDLPIEHIVDDNKVMEVWLKARSIQPATKQKDKVKQIIEWGNMNNKKIVFIRD